MYALKACTQMFTGVFITILKNLKGNLKLSPVFKWMKSDDPAQWNTIQ